MQNSKILVAIGISILQALVIIGAIALGFYMGQSTRSTGNTPALVEAQTGGGSLGGAQQGNQAGPGGFGQPGGGQGGGFENQQGGGQGGGSGEQRPLPPGLDTPPDRIGHVAEVADGTITIMSKQEQVTVQYSDQTECVGIDGAGIECGTITADQVIAVYGTADSSGQTFAATKIVVLPPRPQGEGNGAGGNQGGAPQP